MSRAAETHTRGARRGASQTQSAARIPAAAGPKARQIPQIAPATGADSRGHTKDKAPDDTPTLPQAPAVRQAGRTAEPAAEGRRADKRKQRAPSTPTEATAPSEIHSIRARCDTPPQSEA
mgnify:CR=1 FL=1